jgi:hypothetical protein
LLDIQQQANTFVPAEAVTPADVQFTGQPAGVTSFDITGENRRAIEGFI